MVCLINLTNRRNIVSCCSTILGFKIFTWYQSTTWKLKSSVAEGEMNFEALRRQQFETLRGNAIALARKVVFQEKNISLGELKENKFSRLKITRGKGSNFIFLTELIFNWDAIILQ